MAWLVKAMAALARNLVAHIFELLAILVLIFAIGAALSDMWGYAAALLAVTVVLGFIASRIEKK